MRLRHRFARAGILLALAPDAESARPRRPAPPMITLALVNGRVWTGDPGSRRRAIAIAGERIVAIGTTAEVKKQAGTAETIDLGGQFVVPGFVDSHVHFITAITGGDWDHELWGGELPRRDWIDAATPDHPVWVNRLDGHMALANTAALRAPASRATSRDVAGGEIVRDARRADRGCSRTTR